MTHLRRTLRRLLVRLLPTGPRSGIDAQGRDACARRWYRDGVNAGRAGAWPVDESGSNSTAVDQR